MIKINRLPDRNKEYCDIKPISAIQLNNSFGSSRFLNSYFKMIFSWQKKNTFLLLSITNENIVDITVNFAFGNLYRYIPSLVFDFCLQAEFLGIKNSIIFSIFSGFLVSTVGIKRRNQT